MEENKAEPTEKSASKDAEDNKLMAIIAYFIFFVPLLTDAKDSKFAMFHANQGLILLFLTIIVSIIFMIPFLGWFLLGPLGFLLVFILAVVGIINAAGGKMKELPIIGGIHILDK